MRVAPSSHGPVGFAGADFDFQQFSTPWRWRARPCRSLRRRGRSARPPPAHLRRGDDFRQRFGRGRVSWPSGDGFVFFRAGRRRISVGTAYRGFDASPWVRLRWEDVVSSDPARLRQASGGIVGFRRCRVTYRSPTPANRGVSCSASGKSSAQSRNRWMGVEGAGVSSASVSPRFPGP